MEKAVLPIIYTTHHASHNYGDFSDRCALTEEERIRFSDYGTDLTVPQNGIVVAAEYARGIVDLNRPGDKNKILFPEKDYAKPISNNIWKAGQAPSTKEQVAIKENVYDAYHQRIKEKIEEQIAPMLVVSWDNTAQYAIGENESGEIEQMKPFILSNRGREGSAYGSDAINDPVSCDPELLYKIAELFKKKAGAYGLPLEVHLNLVYKGGNICKTYSTLRNPSLKTSHQVQSFQMEYSTSITHDQTTLEPDMIMIESLRNCWEEVIGEAYLWWVGKLEE